MDALIYTELQPMSSSMQVELTKLRYLFKLLQSNIQVLLPSFNYTPVDRESDSMVGPT